MLQVLNFNEITLETTYNAGKFEGSKISYKLHKEGAQLMIVITIDNKGDKQEESYNIEGTVLGYSIDTGEVIEFKDFTTLLQYAITTTMIETPFHCDSEVVEANYYKLSKQGKIK